MRFPSWFPLVLALPVAAVPALRMSPSSPCVFAGREVERTVEFGEEVSGTLSWSVDVLPTRRPLVRHELVLDRMRKAALRIPVPPLRNGVEMTLELRAALRPQGGVPSELREQFRVMSPEAFSAADRVRLARSLYIVDPAGELGKCLAGCGVTPQVARDPHRLATDKAGILLLAPGAQLARRGLGDALVRLAKGGWRVVVVEPAAGFLAFPPADRFFIGTEAVVPRLGKWLRPRFGTRKGGLALATRRDRVALETGAESKHFCWAELEYASGGSMVFIALPIVSAWADEPTPRYVLRAVLAAKQGVGEAGLGSSSSKRKPE